MVETVYGPTSLDRGESTLLRCLVAAMGGCDPVNPDEVSEKDLNDAMRIAVRNRGLAEMTAGLEGGMSAFRADEMQARQTHYWAVTMTRNNAILSHAARITKALDAAEIRHVYFKGPLLQQQLHGDAFRRPSGDLDLLVGTGDVGRAGKVLSGLGHVPHEGLALWWLPFLGERHFSASDGRCTIDLHRIVQQPGLPQPRGTLDFITGAKRHEAGGSKLPVIALEDHLVVLACNIAKGLFGQKRTLPLICDLKTALDAATADGRASFVDACLRRGVAGTGGLAIDAMSAVFGPSHEDLRRQLGVKSPPLAGLQLPVLNPEDAKIWPRKRLISALACNHRPAVKARVGFWFLASETTRRISSLGKPEDQRAPG